MNTILIYDGNNLAYRSNSVMELSTKDGRRTSAIFGVLNSIPKDVNLLFKEYKMQVSEVIFAWDGGRHKRRTTLYPDYKKNRKHDKTEEEKEQYASFLNQTAIIHEFLETVGVKSIKIKGQEADDIIYGLTKQLTDEREEESRIVIVSTDEDFLQLISDKIYVFSPIKGILYTPKKFNSVFDMDYKSFLDYKILQGDSSDNISGIQGIGEKTSKKLVVEYGGISGILSHPENLMKSKVTSRIFTLDGLETLKRNNQLINLEGFVDLREIAEDIEKAVFEQPYVDDKAAMKFLKEYQLTSIIIKYKDWISTFKQINRAYYD